MDIAEYLKETTTHDIYRKLMNEYKLGKAYRYFKSRHVKEVHFHPVDMKVPVAFLSVRVTPTMRSRADYQVWVALDKDTPDLPGGHIHSAYCTCPVGLHGTCNHVAGLLFRVESAVRVGLTTSQSATAQLCKWNEPTNRKPTKDQPMRVSEYRWKKDYYFHQDFDDDHQTSVRQLATAFKPMTETHEEYTHTDNSVVTDLSNIVRDEVPNCSFIQLVDRKKFPKVQTVECPPSLKSIAASVDVSADVDEQIQEMTANIRLSDEDCELLEKATRGQSSSSVWIEQRIGRVTTSNMKRIYTRVKTIQNNKESNPTALIKTVMGYTGQKSSTYAMKHGVSMEPHAKLMYVRLMKKHHKGFSARDSGLVVYRPKQYIAASPDMVSLCKCCGEGVVEITCPWNCRDTIPTCYNDHNLVQGDSDAHSKLSTDSPYMYQIQGQMACMEVKHADFLVYTPNGYHLERISFDPEIWNTMASRYEYFWMTYIAPELISGSLSLPAEASVECMETDHSYSVTCLPPSTSSAIECSSSRTILTTPLLPPVYLCAVCGLDCEEGSALFAKPSIECSKCMMWLHFDCAGLEPSGAPDEGEAWFCPHCC